jgi:hypothetical protein
MKTLLGRRKRKTIKDVVHGKTRGGNGQFLMVLVGQEGAIGKKEIAGPKNKPGKKPWRHGRTEKTKRQ